MSRDRLGAVRHCVGWASVNDAAAILARALSEFNHKVGRLDYVGIVFDDIDRVSPIYHLLEQVDELVHILEMETIGWLIDDENTSLAAIGGR